jgi:hypothetical protein
MLALLVVAGIGAMMWKTSWALLQDGLGRSTKSDKFYLRAKILDKQGVVSDAAVCYATFLTYPWQKRVLPKVPDVYSFHEKQAPENTHNQMFKVLADLLFVEMLLETSLNSSNVLTSIDQKWGRQQLPGLVTDSDELVKFAHILRGMDQSSNPGRWLVKLAEDISQHGPRAAAELIREVPLPGAQQVNGSGLK